MKFAVIFAALAVSAFAGEFAVLDSGFRIRAESHEESGEIIRLHTREGVIEMSRTRIAAFEPEEEVAAPPPVAPTPPPAPEPAVKLTPQALIDRAAEAHGLPREILHSVARIESAYKVDAVSKAGAIGIMQLMPATAAYLNADPNDPEQNVDAGAKLLRQLLIKYKNYPDQVRRALAAYNAGSGAVDRYNGVPPYQETQLYVEKVLGQYWKLNRANGAR